MPALFPALAGMTAHVGRARPIAVTNHAGNSSPVALTAQVPKSRRPSDPMGRAGFSADTHLAETPFREHQGPPGSRTGRGGVAADPQGRPQGQPRSRGRAPRLLSPRQLARSDHQPCHGERGRDDQRDPHLDRPSGHPRVPGPYAASPVGCGLVPVPRRPPPTGHKRSRACSHPRADADHPFLPVKATFREVTHA